MSDDQQSQAEPATEQDDRPRVKPGQPIFSGPAEQTTAVRADGRKVTQVFSVPEHPGPPAASRRPPARRRPGQLTTQLDQRSWVRFTALPSGSCR